MEEKRNDTYYMTGIVVHGKALGRTVGMPTINLQVEAGEIPPSGVYASTMIVRGKEYRGLTNVGCRPSVDQKKEQTVETYLLRFSEEVYGERVELYIDSFIREIRKFDGIEGVKKQVELDLKAAGIS